MFQSYDDFSLGVPFFKIPESIGSFTQRVTSINDGFDFAGFEKLFHENQVFLA